MKFKIKFYLIPQLKIKTRQQQVVIITTKHIKIKLYPKNLLQPSVTVGKAALLPTRKYNAANQKVQRCQPESTTLPCAQDWACDTVLGVVKLRDSSLAQCVPPCDGPQTSRSLLWLDALHSRGHRPTDVLLLSSTAQLSHPPFLPLPLLVCRPANRGYVCWLKKKYPIRSSREIYVVSKVTSKTLLCGRDVYREMGMV